MNHKEFIHTWIESQNNLNLVFDMTCGNGYDTLFLAENAKQVVAVDIQSAAIQATKTRCVDKSNIHYLNQSHDSIDFSNFGPIDGAVYNLGYLPGSDKTIVTHLDSTLNSLRSIIPYLKRFLVVSCYLKHDGGFDEYIGVKSYLKSLNTDVEEFRYETENSPVTYLIKFKKK